MLKPFNNIFNNIKISLYVTKLSDLNIASYLEICIISKHVLHMELIFIKIYATAFIIIIIIISDLNFSRKII